VSRTITDITEIVLRAGETARQETGNEPEPRFTRPSKALGIPMELFTPIFAVSRVSGWTATVIEYLQNSRIFRPRALYVGAFDRHNAPIGARS
jgi:citrate synthase